MDAYIGEIRLFAGTYAPAGWAFCNGQSLAIRDYEPLYSLIGPIWGGDTQFFNLPDLAGRVPIGDGKGPGLTARVIGQKGGAIEAMAEVPVHGHRFMASTEPATSLDPAGMMLATVTPSGTTTGLYLKTAGTQQTMAPGSVMGSGGGTSHNNVMPSLGLTYIICLYGEYPTHD